MRKSVGKVEITIAELVAAFPAAFTLDRTLAAWMRLEEAPQVIKASNAGREPSPV